MVSILMCTYNRAYCLNQAIDSVLNQTYTDFELLIVDDGSTDETEELVRAYTDSRIKYLKMERNSYYCHAANCGLGHCAGEYVAFINSDDEWLPEKLEKQVAFMEKNKEYGACFSAAYLKDFDGNDITDQCEQMRDVFATRYYSQKECLQSFIHRGNTLCHPSALVRRTMLDQIGGFNLMYCQLADFDLWVRIVTIAPIYVLDEKLIRFRWDLKKGDQISGATRATAIRTFNEQLMIRRDLVERLSDEQFIEFFGDKFKNKSSKSHLEIEFEKAFLLSECIGEVPELKVLGIYKLEEVLKMPGAMETLNNHFGMRIQEIYKWNQAHMYNELWLVDELRSKEVERLSDLHKNELASLSHEYELKMHQLRLEHTEIIKQLRAEYESSSSWKLTAPLRSIMKKIKRKQQLW